MRMQEDQLYASIRTFCPDGAIVLQLLAKAEIILLTYSLGGKFGDR